jgi:hypothetical protein
LAEGLDRDQSEKRRTGHVGCRHKISDARSEQVRRYDHRHSGRSVANRREAASGQAKRGQAHSWSTQRHRAVSVEAPARRIGSGGVACALRRARRSPGASLPNPNGAALGASESEQENRGDEVNPQTPAAAATAVRTWWNGSGPAAPQQPDWQRSRRRRQSELPDL